MVRRHSSVRPRPFLKWAGGKRALLDEILPWLPERIEHYVEPFLGGGAVFLALARLGRVERATLGDRNPELVDTWRAIREVPDQVVEATQQWPHTEEAYYALRAVDPWSLERPERAARMIWLNRTGFNGLYRLNKRGIFNVPFGRHSNPRIVDADNIHAVSRALQSVELVKADFEDILERADNGSVVYCDPPYWPVSATANFTAYDRLKFGEDDQARLAVAFSSLGTRGVWGVLSNSWVDSTRALYGHLEHRTVYVRRNINRNAEGRGQVAELLVRTRPRAPQQLSLV